MVTGWRPVLSVRRGQRFRPPATASRWRTRASGATTTREPATWLRQERSRSSPMATMPASKPLSSREEVGPDEDAPTGATKTSRTASCCPWSTSPSWMRSTTAPVLSQLIPTCRRIEGSSQLTNFGETTPALERNDSSTSLCTASGSSATSSWHSRKKAAPSTMPSTSLDGGGVAGSPRQVAHEGVRAGSARPVRSPSAPSAPVARTSTESSS